MKKSNLRTDRLKKKNDYQNKIIIMMKTSIKSEQTNGQRKLKTEYSLVYGIFSHKKSAVYLFHLKNVRQTDIQMYILDYIAKTFCTAEKKTINKPKTRLENIINIKRSNSVLVTRKFVHTFETY